MYSVPQIKIEKFDQKGQLAISELSKLQEKLVENDSFRLSQLEIVRLAQLIFKARLGNQQLLNQWYQQSVEQMVQNVYNQFKTTQRQTILNDLLHSLNILISYIYYSGVFLIDAKESNSLFTIGIHLLRDVLILPFITQINEDIWKIINELPQNSSIENIQNCLFNAKNILKIIKACGWTKVYISKNQNTFEFKQDKNEENSFYNSKFEQYYIKQFKLHLKNQKHTFPLTPLKQELLQHRQIVDYISPLSKKVIIDSVEIITIKEILSNVTEENMEDVVNLFTVIEKNGSSLKPFHQLATVFSQNLLSQNIKQIDQLILFINKYEDFLITVLHNHPILKKAYLDTLEIIVNSFEDIDTKILQSSEIHQYHSRIISLLHGATYLKILLDQIIENKANQIFIEELQQKVTPSSSLWFKIKELSNLNLAIQSQITQVKQQKQEIASLIIAKQLQFNQLQYPTIMDKQLPQKLKCLLTTEKDKKYLILLNKGYGVVQFLGNYTLILSNAQMIAILLIEENDARKEKLNELSLKEAVEELLTVGIVQQREELIYVNNDWVPKSDKKVISFVKS